MSMYEFGIEDGQDEAPMQKSRRAPYWVFVLVALLIALAGLWWQITRPDDHVKHAAVKQSARAAYLMAQGEMDTGRRLARLDDFLAQYPNSPARDFARTQSEVLHTYEQSAWAKMTKSQYDLTLDQDAKTEALNDYIRVWGPILRQADIAKFKPNPVNDAASREKAFSFAMQPSKYANTNDGAHGDIVMAGDISHAPLRVQPSPPPIIMRAARPAAQPKLRVRVNKTPSYPKKAKRKRIEAVVVLALDIDDAGRVRRTHVVSVDALNYQKNFIKSAERAARRTKFYPLMQNGTPVPIQGYQRVYRFQLAQN